MEIDKNSGLYRELVLRSKIIECCKACRHYSLKLDDDFCTLHDAWIYGCTCKKKAKYLARFQLSEEDLDWEISFLTGCEDETKYDFTNRKPEKDTEK